MPKDIDNKKRKNSKIANVINAVTKGSSKKNTRNEISPRTFVSSKDQAAFNITQIFNQENFSKLTADSFEKKSKIMLSKQSPTEINELKSQFKISAANQLQEMISPAFVNSDIKLLSVECVSANNNIVYKITIKHNDKDSILSLMHCYNPLEGQSISASDRAIAHMKDKHLGSYLVKEHAFYSKKVRFNPDSGLNDEQYTMRIMDWREGNLEQEAIALLTQTLEERQINSLNNITNVLHMLTQFSNNNIIFADIKPSNILGARIADFKSLSFCDDASKESALIPFIYFQEKSDAYVSPKEMSRNVFDDEQDIRLNKRQSYTVGIMFYQLLLGLSAEQLATRVAKIDWNAIHADVSNKENMFDFSDSIFANNFGMACKELIIKLLEPAEIKRITIDSAYDEVLALAETFVKGSNPSSPTSSRTPSPIIEDNVFSLNGSDTSIQAHRAAPDSNKWEPIIKPTSVQPTPKRDFLRSSASRVNVENPLNLTEEQKNGAGSSSSASSDEVKPNASWKKTSIGVSPAQQQHSTFFIKRSKMPNPVANESNTVVNSTTGSTAPSSLLAH